MADTLSGFTRVGESCFDGDPLETVNAIWGAMTLEQKELCLRGGLILGRCVVRRNKDGDEKLEVEFNVN